MIWDRIFGTYRTQHETVVFGVVSKTPKTFDANVLEFCYLRDIIEKYRSVNGLTNKLSALFKGPGWAPGKDRLGDIADVPFPDPYAPKYSYDPFIPYWKKCYIIIHFAILVYSFYILADHPNIVSKLGK